MFPARFFAAVYFASRYFPEVGLTLTTGDGRIEFTIPNSRLDFTITGRPDFSIPDSRLDFTASKSS